jgi:hypothetical protein
MVLKRIACGAAILCLSGAASADDMIYNGLHCNSLCQVWMGIRPEHPAQEGEVLKRIPKAGATPPFPAHGVVSKKPSASRHEPRMSMLPASTRVGVSAIAPIDPFELRSSTQTDRVRPAPTLPGGATTSAPSLLDTQSSMTKPVKKLRCANIVSHSAEYDADLVLLCQFLARTRGL